MLIKMENPSGGGGEPSNVLEGVIISKWGATVYYNNFDDTSQTSTGNFTGNYIKNTANNKFEALVDCRVYVKNYNGLPSVNDYSAGDTILSYSTSSMGGETTIAVLVLS